MTPNEDGYDGGFAVIPRAIQRDPSISGRAKLVYLALSSRANDQMQCWPSQATIAKEAGMSVDSVTRALAELRDRNLLDFEIDPTKGSPGRHPCRYTLGGLGGPDSAVRHTADSGTTYRTQRYVIPHTAVRMIQENDAIEGRTPPPLDIPQPHPPLTRRRNKPNDAADDTHTSFDGPPGLRPW